LTFETPRTPFFFESIDVGLSPASDALAQATIILHNDPTVYDGARSIGFVGPDKGP
jgi:hypothetical protein